MQACSLCLTLLSDRLCHTLSLGAQIVDHVFHGTLVFQEKRPDHVFVQNCRAVP